MDVLHLSDPHFGAINGTVPEILIQHVRQHPADLILLTGDITQRAYSHQFAQAAKFVSGLSPHRVLMTPGNHDLPLFDFFLRLFNPYRDFRKYLQKDLSVVLGVRDVGIAVLNSTTWYRHIQGEIEIANLVQCLKALNGAKFKIVAFHHPMACRNPVDQKNLLVNRTVVEKVLKEFKVDLVVGGHIHDPFVTVTPQLIIAVSGTCTSHRIRYEAPNSFNRYKILDDGIKLLVERYDLSRRGEFELVSSSEFSKSSAGWRATASADQSR